MEIRAEIEEAIDARIRDAEARFGPFASTHESLGVACEEWAELIDAIRMNKLGSVQQEALDLAAVLIRLAGQCEEPTAAFRMRSGA